LINGIKQYLDHLLQRPAAAKDAAESFLPNFCKGEMIVNVLVIAEMLALVITLVSTRLSPSVFKDLFIISIFVQWIALTSVVTLCALRNFLNRLNRLQAIGLTYILLLLITIVVTEAYFWVLWLAGKLAEPHPDWYGAIHIQVFAVSVVVNAVGLKYLLGVHELQQRTASEERAKLSALQARIRPHFVFNSLNIIASLTRTAPKRAEEAIEDMADLFRMMLGEAEATVPLKKEIEVTNKYLAVEQLRLDERLRVEWDIGKFARRAAVPVLTLQPLIENAIRHGVEPSPTGGLITVRLWEENETINIEVTHSLPARRTRREIEEEEQAVEEFRLRLHSYYGETATVTGGENNGQFAITVRLPLRGESE